LYQRNLYVLAINMAQKAGVDRAHQNVILRKFGDYLYQKQDYDTAMQQYLKAIDNTEPSQIIRKVRDEPLTEKKNFTEVLSFWTHNG
jgi:vacuolar protein sorting-associated protein 11